MAILLQLAAVLLTVGLAVASAKVIEVNPLATWPLPTNTYQDIPTALAQAATGDTILVYPTVYLYTVPAFGSVETQNDLCNATKPAADTINSVGTSWYSINTEIRVRSGVTVLPKCPISYPVGFLLTSWSSCRMLTVLADNFQLSGFSLATAQCTGTESLVEIKALNAVFTNNNITAPNAVFASVNLFGAVAMGLNASSNVLNSNTVLASFFNVTGSVLLEDNTLLGSVYVYRFSVPTLTVQDDVIVVDLDAGLDLSGLALKCIPDDTPCPSCPSVPCTRVTDVKTAAVGMTVILIVAGVGLAAILSIIGFVLYRRHHTYVEIDEDGNAVQKNAMVEPSNSTSVPSIKASGSSLRKRTKPDAQY